MYWQIGNEMNASTPDDPGRWRNVLARSSEQWVGVRDIQGIWTTEEVGIRAAENGNGASAALRVMVRYLDWISEFRYAGNTARWKAMPTAFATATAIC